MWQRAAGIVQVTEVGAAEQVPCCVFASEFPGRVLDAPLSSVGEDGKPCSWLGESAAPASAGASDGADEAACDVTAPAKRAAAGDAQGQATLKRAASADAAARVADGAVLRTEPDGGGSAAAAVLAAAGAAAGAGASVGSSKMVESFEEYVEYLRRRALAAHPRGVSTQFLRFGGRNLVLFSPPARALGAAPIAGEEESAV